MYKACGAAHFSNILAKAYKKKQHKPFFNLHNIGYETNNGD